MVGDDTPKVFDDQNRGGGVKTFVEYCYAGNKAVKMS
jgi:hypothetical protein